MALALALSVGVGFTAPPELLWSVFGSGGNSSSSTNYDLGSTSGQSSPIGASGSTNYSLNAGFWTGLQPAGGGGKLAWPGDTDGDGCPGVNENQDKSEFVNGGGRDWLNPYDYYDVTGDDAIVLIGDITGVIAHFTPGGYPTGQEAEYAVYDRGPSAGPNPWNLTAPDGVIVLIGDITGVIRQFNPGGCTDPG